MTKKQIFVGIALSTIIVAQAGAASHLAAQHIRLQKRYAELYELAAYLAGKAEGAGVVLDETDRMAMKAMMPDR